MVTFCPRSPPQVTADKMKLPVQYPSKVELPDGVTTWMRQARSVPPMNHKFQVCCDSTAMTPVPVTSRASGTTSLASQAASVGSVQSGITVVLVAAVNAAFLVVNPQGSLNTSGLPGESPPDPTRISNLVPGITVGAVIVVAPF